MTERTVTFRRLRLLPAPPAHPALPTPQSEPAPAAQPSPVTAMLNNAPFRRRKPAPLEFAPDRKPYERQIRESIMAYDAFKTYRELPVGLRTYQNVANALKKTVGLMGGWSRRWRWADRVRAWDAEQDRIMQERLADEEAAHRSEMLRLRREAVVLHQRTGHAMVQAAALRLAGRTADGKVIARLPIEALGAQDVSRLAKDGVFIERQSLGMPVGPQTEIMAGTAAGPSGAGAMLRIIIRDEAAEEPDQVIVNGDGSEEGG